MTQDDAWLALADGPIAEVVRELEAADPSLTAALDDPEKLLAFRTFAAIRVGIALGELLMEHPAEQQDESGTWVEALLSDPRHRERIQAEVRAVADELADAQAESGAGPDEAMRERFRAFARRVGA